MARRDATHPDKMGALGRQLLGEALPEERTLAALATGLKAVHRAACKAIGPMIGYIWLRMWLARATRQAAVRYPFLNDVAVYEDDLDVEPALIPKGDSDYDSVRAGFEDLLATFLELLAELVGQSMTELMMSRVAERLRKGDNRSESNER